MQGTTRPAVPRAVAIAIAVVAAVWLLFGCASTVPVDSEAVAPAIGEAEGAIDVEVDPGDDGDEPHGDEHVSDPEPGPDLPPDPDPAPPPGPDPVPAPPPGPVGVLHALVNEARASPRTCGARGSFEAAQPLALEARLMVAAQRHSDDMHANGFMSHTGSDGSTLAQRVEREGYAWRALGENVARGYVTPEGVMSAWLASDGHCANVMNPAFVELGLGLEGWSWTQLFARPW